MRPLVLFVSAVSLALALAACGGNDGAESAGPAPSVPVETAPSATSVGGTADAVGTSYEDQLVEYVNQADAICKRAADKLEATLAALPEGADMWDLAYQDLYFDITAEALAELRALPLPGTGAMYPVVNPVALCSHRRGLQQNASGPTRAEFIAQANEICRAAESRFDSEIVEPGQTLPEESEATARIERWALEWEAAADIMEEALARLRALPQPEVDRALLEEGFFQVVEQEIYALRSSAAAAFAGDYARMHFAGMERVHLTHQRDGFTARYGLGGCPVSLPA
jgi:hypothetical protein